MKAVCNACQQPIKVVKEIDLEKKEELKAKRKEMFEQKKALKEKIKNFTGDRNGVEYNNLIWQLLDSMKV